MNASQINAVRAVARMFLDTIKEAGPQGAPGGVMYAACTGRLSLSQFQQILGTLESRGYVRREGDLYFHVRDL